jgi:myosin-15
MICTAFCSFFACSAWTPNQSDKNISEAMESPASSFSHKHHLQLPSDIDHHAFSKFTNIYFRTHVWGCKRDPIQTPFLPKTSESDFHDSLSLFKVVSFCFIVTTTIASLIHTLFS